MDYIGQLITYYKGKLTIGKFQEYNEDFEYSPAWRNYVSV